MKYSKMLAIIALLVPLAASAAVTPGFFEGNMELGNHKRVDVRVFIQTLSDENSGAAYGLILEEHGKGSLFRIEELPDGTQAWIHLHQGKNRVLRVNAEESATLKGMMIGSSGCQKLKLVPVDQASSCQGKMKEIIVEASSDQQWIAIPQSVLFKRSDRGSRGVIQGDQFTGSLVFENASHEGSFSLGKILPSLATVRAQVLDPQALSGWAMSRELLGAAVTIKKKAAFLGSEKTELTVLELPAGDDSCWSLTTTLSAK